MTLLLQQRLQTKITSNNCSYKIAIHFRSFSAHCLTQYSSWFGFIMHERNLCDFVEINFNYKVVFQWRWFHISRYYMLKDVVCGILLITGLNETWNGLPILMSELLQVSLTYCSANSFNDLDRWAADRMPRFVKIQLCDWTRTTLVFMCSDRLIQYFLTNFGFNDIKERFWSLYLVFDAGATIICSY